MLARQPGGQRCIQAVDGGQVDRVVALQLAHIAERIGIWLPELRHIGCNAVQRALVGGSVVIPVLEQRADAGLIGVNADRRVHASPARHEAVQPANPVELLQQAARVGIVRAERLHASQRRLGAIEVAPL